MIFTNDEREYLATQRLGRLATVDAKGEPQNNPVGFTYNTETGTMDIRGWHLARTRKYRNISGNDRVAFVVDDLASVKPWHVRGIKNPRTGASARGLAQAGLTCPKAAGARSGTRPSRMPNPKTDIDTSAILQPSHSPPTAGS